MDATRLNGTSYRDSSDHKDGEGVLVARSMTHKVLSRLAEVQSPLSYQLPSVVVAGQSILSL